VPYYRNDEVQFKEVGIKVTAEPIVMGHEIDLKISATLSGQSAHIEGAIDRNTVSTSAVIKRGQSVVLGGIVHNGDVITRNRVPKGIDTSTALFSLFRSKDFQSKRSEFVIFVTPRVFKQPRAADAELQQWMQTEEGIVKERDKKEYRSYLEKRGRSLPPRRRRKNKWR
jgi:type II secretory pathway component GspD/PulD (secretin)